MPQHPFHYVAGDGEGEEKGADVIMASAEGGVDIEDVTTKKIC